MPMRDAARVPAAPAAGPRAPRLLAVLRARFLGAVRLPPARRAAARRSASCSARSSGTSLHAHRTRSRRPAWSCWPRCRSSWACSCCCRRSRSTSRTCRAPRSPLRLPTARGPAGRQLRMRSTHMCGIFGVVFSRTRRTRTTAFVAGGSIEKLYRFSETRGREAVGIAVLDGKQIEVLKQGGSVTDFLANPRLHAAARAATRALRARRRARADARDHRPLAARDQRRQSNTDNNQPVITHGAVALHNGIVVNDRRARGAVRARSAQGELDSEVLAALLRTKLDESQDLVAATRADVPRDRGLGLDRDDVRQPRRMLLATNTGSLFQLDERERHGDRVRVGAVHPAARARATSSWPPRSATAASSRSAPATRSRSTSTAMRRHAFSLAARAATSRRSTRLRAERSHGRDRRSQSRADRLKRCTKCILPETYPFVDFDAARRLPLLPHVEADHSPRASRRCSMPSSRTAARTAAPT